MQVIAVGCYCLVENSSNDFEKPRMLNTLPVKSAGDAGVSCDTF